MAQNLGKIVGCAVSSIKDKTILLLRREGNVYEKVEFSNIDYSRKKIKHLQSKDKDEYIKWLENMPHKTNYFSEN